VAKIDQALLAALERKLGTTKSNIYRLIEEKTRSSFLPRHLAAIALAAERGVNIAKFASHEELERIRSTNNTNHGVAAAARAIILRSYMSVPARTASTLSPLLKPTRQHS
jgi:hypothetical protein